MTTTPTLSPLDRVRARPAATGSHTFAYDPNDATAINEAREVAEAAEREAEQRPKSVEAKKTATSARRAVKKLITSCVTETLTLKAVGVAAIEKLQHDHPPTDEQIEAASEDSPPVADTHTYAPAVIALALVDLVFSDDKDRPVTELTDDDASALWDSLSMFDQLEVLSMINALNARSSKVDRSGKG